MEHTKEKMKLTEGIHFYLVPENGDFVIAEIPESYESDFGMSRELLKANAERLCKCWNQHDGLVDKIAPLTTDLKFVNGTSQLRMNTAQELITENQILKTRITLFNDMREVLKLFPDRHVHGNECDCRFCQVKNLLERCKENSIHEDDEEFVDMDEDNAQGWLSEVMHNTGIGNIQEVQSLIATLQSYVRTADQRKENSDV